VIIKTRLGVSLIIDMLSGEFLPRICQAVFLFFAGAVDYRYNGPMPDVSAVFFDFDGVLCTDRFYTTLLPDYPLASKFIGNSIFGGAHQYADRWMRGEFTYHQINRIISDATGMPFEKLTELFRASVRQMRLNPSLIQFALSLNKRGTRTALVTCNMDVFNEITVPEKGLDAVFPVIVNSFDYGLLKHEENGKMFDIALEKLGLDSYREVWLIDDSPIFCAAFEAKGGRAYRYTGLKDFELWLKNDKQIPVTSIQ
jgi:FMN phosphatase YigB (HAD superfamily)